MARGWRRQLTGFKTSGFVKPNAGTKKGDFDHWEPLGRFLMPELHARVDEVWRERRSNKVAQETTVDDANKPEDVAEPNNNSDDEPAQSTTEVSHEEEAAGDENLAETDPTTSNAAQEEKADAHNAAVIDNTADVGAALGESTSEAVDGMLNDNVSEVDSSEGRSSHHSYDRTTATDPVEGSAAAVSQEWPSDEVVVNAVYEVTPPVLMSGDEDAHKCCICHLRSTSGTDAYVSDVVCENCFLLCANMPAPITSSNGTIVPPDFLNVPPRSPGLLTLPPPRLTPPTLTTPSNSGHLSETERPLYPSTHYRCTAAQNSPWASFPAAIDGRSTHRPTTPPPQYSRYADPLYHYPIGRHGRNRAIVDNEVAAANQNFFVNHPPVDLRTAATLSLPQVDRYNYAQMSGPFPGYALPVQNFQSPPASIFPPSPPLHPGGPFEDMHHNLLEGPPGAPDFAVFDGYHSSPPHPDQYASPSNIQPYSPFVHPESALQPPCVPPFASRPPTAPPLPPVWAGGPPCPNPARTPPPPWFFPCPAPPENRPPSQWPPFT